MAGSQTLKLSAQLAELLDECVQQTKQPQLHADILRYIKNVTLSLHRMERFWKDIEILQWEATNPSMNRTIDLVGQEIPRHREVLQVAGAGRILTKLTVSEALGAIVKNKTNCWYQLGHALHVKTCTPVTKLQLAYLAIPDVSDSGYKSWLAAEHKYAIIDEVSMMIFSDTGQNDKMQSKADRVRTVHKLEILREQLLSQDAEILSAEYIMVDRV